MSSSPYQVITGGREWPSRYTFSPAVRIENLLFISGTTATDENNQIVGRGNIVAQTRQIFSKFQKLLAAVGASFDDIVQTTEYITTTEGYKSTAEVRREFFKNGFPAATGVVVAGLF